MDLDRRKLAVTAVAAIVLGFILHGYMQALTTNHVVGNPKPVPRPEAEVNEVDCFTHLGNGETGVIEIDISNTGEIPLDMNPVDFTVRMPDGDINHTLSHRGVSFAPEHVRASTEDGIAILATGGGNEWPNPSSYVLYQINATKNVKLERKMRYSITIDGLKQYGELKRTCTARTP